MLASPHDGERATAARIASDLLRAEGLSWRDLLTGKRVPHPVKNAPPKAARASGKVRRHPEYDLACELYMEAADAFPPIITSWELNFLETTVAGYMDRPFTEKQLEVLARIKSKVDRAATRRA